jgi:hypothetical protein
MEVFKEIRHSKLRKIKISDPTDDVTKEGTLRYYLEGQKTSNVRIVFTKDCPKIILNSPLEMRKLENVIIAGYENNIEISGWSFGVQECKNIILAKIAFRPGEKQILKFYGGKRPESSVGLDGINVDDSENVLIEKCSIWWSCDELLSVTNSKNVFVTQTLFLFPLGGSELLHPYGEYHAECANCSANEVCSFNQCFFGFYRMRGPQFEPNDAAPGQSIKMEAINNVMYGFRTAGSRYRSGEEKASDKVKGTTYEFQFIKNLYISAPQDDPCEKCIVCDDSYSPTDKVSVFIDGNMHWNIPEKTIGRVDKIVNNDGKDLGTKEKNQIKSKKLFETGIKGNPILNHTTFFTKILSEAGVNDELDKKAKEVIKTFKPWAKMYSSDSVLDYLYGKEQTEKMGKRAMSIREKRRLEMIKF